MGRSTVANTSHSADFTVPVDASPNFWGTLSSQVGWLVSLMTFWICARTSDIPVLGPRGLIRGSPSNTDLQISGSLGLHLAHLQFALMYSTLFSLSHCSCSIYSSRVVGDPQSVLWGFPPGMSVLSTIYIYLRFSPSLLFVLAVWGHPHRASVDHAASLTTNNKNEPHIAQNTK